MVQCPLLTQSGQATCTDECPLLGVSRHLRGQRLSLRINRHISILYRECLRNHGRFMPVSQSAVFEQYLSWCVAFSRKNARVRTAAVSAGFFLVIGPALFMIGPAAAKPLDPKIVNKAQWDASFESKKGISPLRTKVEILARAGFSPTALPPFPPLSPPPAIPPTPYPPSPH